LDGTDLSQKAYLCVLQGSGSTPDVWLQLLECCAAEPDCHPSVIRSLAQQLAQQRAAAEQQQQQNAAQQEQIVCLQGQLSAQQRVAVQQGALIAGLQEQLQQLLEHKQ
jgi:hypothetical protein